ncbi:MAG TPA: sulfite exporter TauE/SafE family protein [Anaerovoracaceae bacterium]|nr:sulfite exporter TauE/SafE family protein [Anaerovoracaceae bacterium]
MDSRAKRMKLRIGGMTCVSCQNKIEKKLLNTAGISHASVDYSKGTAEIEYDPDIITLKDIKTVIERLDYEVITDQQAPAGDKSRGMGLLILILALFMLMQQFGVTNLFNSFPLAEAGMGYGVLLLIGLLTSVHCIAMCGGINLSQCIPQSGDQGGSRFASLGPSFLYNFGRVISYTIIGGIVGALGSAISFSGVFRGSVQLAAGVFMVIMGVNMLGIFPWLRRFNPRMPKVFAQKIDAEKGRSKSPLYVGLLNGLMPCGPLQAMQLYALSTGSVTKGALSMLLFSLGTVPLMFGLGALSSVLSKKFTRKVMTVGAVLVVVLGLSMFTNGWSLSGLSNIAFANTPEASEGTSDIAVEDGVQIINSTLSSGRYPAITVQAGIPVKWTIDAPNGSINGCNNRIIIPEYNIEYQFESGENVIEFTPDKTGKFQYSCWMGMIRGSITVVEPGTEIPPNGGADADVPPENGGFDGGSPEPVPANVSIPADEIAIAEKKDDYQEVTIQLTDEGFSPAVIVIQSDSAVQWNIDNSSTNAANFNLLVPAYAAQAALDTGVNPLGFIPIGSFEFSNGDNTFYGYVKVVDDISVIDTEAIRQEVRDYKTKIWPPETFEASGAGGASCH